MNISIKRLITVTILLAVFSYVILSLLRNNTDLDVSEHKPTPTLQFCGGIVAIPCPASFTCKLDGTYPDAGGTCIKN